MRKIITNLFLLFLAAPLPATASGDARNDKGLTAILAKLNEADGYTYTVSVSSEIIGRPGEKEVTKMVNYQSKKSFILYSKTDDMLLFLCDAGQFRVNIKDKEVYYAEFSRDPAVLQQQKTQMMAAFAAMSVDSFFLNGASVAGKADTKARVTYKLKYEPESMIRELVIDYNPQTAFFTSIQYSVEKAIAGSSAPGQQPELVLQKVLMDHYVREIPVEVKQLLTDTRELKAYLERTYKGYHIERI